MMYKLQSVYIHAFLAIPTTSSCSKISAKRSFVISGQWHCPQLLWVVGVVTLLSAWTMPSGHEDTHLGLKCSYPSFRDLLLLILFIGDGLVGLGLNRRHVEEVGSGGHLGRAGSARGWSWWWWRRWRAGGGHGIDGECVGGGGREPLPFQKFQQTPSKRVLKGEHGVGGSWSGHHECKKPKQMCQKDLMKIMDESYPFIVSFTLCFNLNLAFFGGFYKF